MIPTLRTLTKKSKLGFGRHKDYTVQNLLDRRKHLDLVAAYYKLTSINFMEEILLELKIQEEDRVKKPGVDLIKYNIVLNKYPKKIINKAIDKLKLKHKSLTKQQLQAINHGH